MAVSISRFRAKLGQYMRIVRGGREVVITDRGHAVARLVPAATSGSGRALETSRPRNPAAPPLGRIQVRAIIAPGIETTRLLREDRDRR